MKLRVKWRVVRLDGKDMVVRISAIPGQVPKIYADRKLTLSQYIRLVNMLASDLLELEVGKSEEHQRMKLRY